LGYQLSPNIRRKEKWRKNFVIQKGFETLPLPAKMPPRLPKDFTNPKIIQGKLPEEGRNLEYWNIANQCWPNPMLTRPGKKEGFQLETLTLPPLRGGKPGHQIGWKPPKWSNPSQIIK